MGASRALIAASRWLEKQPPSATSWETTAERSPVRSSFGRRTIDEDRVRPSRNSRRRWAVLFQINAQGGGHRGIVGQACEPGTSPECLKRPGRHRTRLASAICSWASLGRAVDGGACARTPRR